MRFGHLRTHPPTTRRCPEGTEDLANAPREAAAVGVAEHANTAVPVTVAHDGGLLDRRRVELTDRGLPTQPYHHQGSWAVGHYLNTPGARPIPLADAVALVERVRDSAARGWWVHWYHREGVFRDAAAVLGLEDFDAVLRAMGRSIGPPWQAGHKLAAAAALAATRAAH